jgi:hypothetical protein
MDSRDDGGFTHDEADVTVVAYMLQAAEFGKDVIRILCDDTDVFVMLVYHVLGMEDAIELHCADEALEWNSSGYQRNLY